MRFLPANLDAVLVELDDLPTTLALLASLQAEPIDGVHELVPAARTVLVRWRPEIVGVERVVADIARRPLGAVVERPTARVEIPVVYDGEDLDEVAGRLGLTRDEVVRRHTAREYTVAFTGFAPGFAYLSGGDPSLDMPRRPVPRTRIPAGAVGLAGPFSGVYPQASPGGWQIIGTTGVPMWDLARDPPALLQPGFKVRFVDAGARRRDASTPAAPASISGSARSTPGRATGTATATTQDQDQDQTPCTPALRILATGPQALFQDAGRYGQVAQGVAASGAMDRAALRTANRLVGNPADAACIEIALGGFRVRSHGDTVLAFAGAPAPVDLRPAGGGAPPPCRTHEAIALSDGDVLALGAPATGQRSYLAVRGGFAVEPVLGSRSTDTLARVGPPPVRVGDRIPIRAVARGAIVGWPEVPPDDLPGPDAVVGLDVVMGPRTDWFTEAAVACLAAQAWQVTPQSDRIGLRLAGEAALAREVPGELPSEGTVAGAIQVPPSGQPVLFLADHPLTGGYPVIAAVAPYHLDRAGQVPIGAWIRFRPLRPFGALAAPASVDAPDAP